MISGSGDLRAERVPPLRNCFLSLCLLDSGARLTLPCFNSTVLPAAPGVDRRVEDPALLRFFFCSPGRSVFFLKSFSGGFFSHLLRSLFAVLEPSSLIFPFHCHSFDGLMSFEIFALLCFEPIVEDCGGLLFVFSFLYFFRSNDMECLTNAPPVRGIRLALPPPP